MKPPLILLRHKSSTAKPIAYVAKVENWGSRSESSIFPVF